MHHLIGLLFSVTSLGLVCAIYYSLKPSVPEDRLQGEASLSILVSSLTGFFLLAVAILTKDVWLMINGVGPATVVSSAVELLNLGIIVATLIAFRATLKMVARQATGTATVSPFPTRPGSPRPSTGIDKKAA